MMVWKSILVVEDDQSIRNLIKTALETVRSYFIYSADSASSALTQEIARKPDLIILDLGLPDMDGLTLIRKLRSWSDRPIIVVSARKEDRDKIAALDLGADDYLTKPFSVEELLARIRVALRKTPEEGPSKTDFQNGGLQIDYISRRVTLDGREVHLTPLEYKLLCLLAQNAGRVLTQQYLLNHGWGYSGDSRTLRVFMATLRKKIEKDPSNPLYIRTCIGVGYQMNRIS